MRSAALSFVFLLLACHGDPPRSETPVSAAPPATPCGQRPGDWCPSAAGDPCGEHKDKASCQADERCVGMPYRGESLVACKLDDRGFASNCPTVGCMQKP